MFLTLAIIILLVAAYPKLNRYLQKKRLERNVLQLQKVIHNTLDNCRHRIHHGS